MSTKKYFPIKTDTACQLKWNWSTLYLYVGNTASCHRTGWGKITPDTFDTFHNTEKKIQERKQMLQGQWPTDSCSYCRNIEAAGGFSDRQLHLGIPDQSPVELETDPTATVVTPTILEVFFNQTCNMSCLYCTPRLSSKINQENRKFGNFVSNGVELLSVDIDPNYSEMLTKFWNWMEQNSNKLKRFNVLGGEPFYQVEFDACLDYFERTHHPDLELGIVTNLMLSDEKLQYNLDRLKNLLIQRRLKRIDLTCSIDCLGPEQEFVRYGMNLNTWMRNFDTVLKQKWLTVNINQTISLLTIKTMPELLKKLAQWRTHRTVGHYFSVVTPRPSFLAPTILNGCIFDKDFETIVNLMPTDTERDCTAREYMQGIAREVAQSRANTDEIIKLKTYLNEMDRRRNTSWQQVFPWLAEEIEHVVQ
jgi:hypothetical protein